jgi:hypothetical protein
MMQRLLVAAATLAILAGCSGSSAANPPGTPTDICNFANVPEFTLVSPASGATNVSDTTSALQFSGTLFNQSNATESIDLVASNGTSSTLSTFNATRGGYSVPLPTLASGTMYTVNYVITNSGASVAGACASLSTKLGSFTTQ